MFPVSPEKEKALRKKLDSLDIFEKDLKESFTRSRGPGGQNVNRTATCVHLKHLPTGLEVKCQKGRTQGLNRYYARLSLISKVERLIRGRESAEQQKIEKLKRQKRRRSRRSKEKMLRDKKIQSRKKMERSHKVVHNGSHEL